MTKIYHKASKICADGSVSAMCYKTPRAIALTHALWTIRDQAVTCKKCLKIMQLNQLKLEMANEGVIKKELDSKFFGIIKPSRGYYIVIQSRVIWYLHHDGVVRKGVNGNSDNPAFWPTFDAAKDFFDIWRRTIIGA